jgi:redox-sensitive bicupin YhaK (pirin superfamily)
VSIDTKGLRNIRATASAPRAERGLGFNVAFLRPEPIGGGMDPFLQVDAFALAEPVFAPHPHAGFNAVTYIFPESPIGFINRDSLGTRNRIGPGALHWTMAGSGILHEEVPEQRGVAALGLQIFVNLPAALKHAAPRFIHAEVENLPVLVRDGTTVRAVIGSSNGIASPLAVPTPGVRLIDVTLSPGSRYEQELEHLDNAFLWIFSGTATAVTPRGSVPLASFDHVGYANDGDRICLEGGPDGARLVLFAGPPLDEPIAARGPFVMATADDLDKAFANYRSGKMGTLTPTVYGPDQRPLGSG